HFKPLGRPAVGSTDEQGTALPTHSHLSGQGKPLPSMNCGRVPSWSKMAETESLCVYSDQPL
ncbi:unnamed protein product, partial [Heterosigma akashiwo]